MPYHYDIYREVELGWTPDACGYENNVLIYNWEGMELEHPAEFILASLLED
jgi:hypothetical protein